MTKKDLIDLLARKIEGLSRKEAEAVLNTVFDSMADSLAEGEKIEIRGFGSFTVRERKAREGRNPRTGEKVQVPARKVPAFKPGKELKKKVGD